MLELNTLEEVHVVGIGGAGMSAIARVLQARGSTVHGSDQQEGLLLTALRDEGIAVHIGHDPAHIGAAGLVLASSAVPDDNPELVAAREREIPVMRRPEFLPILTAGYQVIAISGAHGKTTVTGMIASVLLEAGLDPTFIVGGVVQNLGTNARAGSGPYFVIEADEYKNTFLALKSQIAVVTNIEFDHPDVFPNLRFLRLAFGDFVDGIKPDGLLVACNDDFVAHAVAASFHANGGRLALYGMNDDLGLALQATEIKGNDRGGVDFKVVREGYGQLCEVSLAIPGAYNAVNALAVLLVAEELGIDFKVTAEILSRFEGTARRFEILGEVDGITVIDDYAHHPTQIKSVLSAARLRYPGRRLVAVWQPHTFSRIKALHDEFLNAFDAADQVLVLPIYAAREKDDGSLNHNDLAAQIQHSSVAAVVSLDAAVEWLKANVESGAVVLLMGAGDEYVVGQKLLHAKGR
ncbi:MAG: UDP-N-acetylmuramate--L-alanine ligase [Anaerolineae bacterium]|nr:UDP-N-acetylmuramate--L-alanine ligase [Anaerolineae bacterium]